MKELLSLFVFLFVVVNDSFSQEVVSIQSYPRTTGFISILHPIVTFDKNGSTFNFSHSYSVGFPVGINILKSDKIGFSLEMIPMIKAENGTDKVSNIIIHPGIMFRHKHGFTFITRIAFETSGRYGFTPVFNKVLIEKKYVKYFISVALPVRFGNEKPASIGIGFQTGISF
jgi:hypothetical protein